MNALRWQLWGGRLVGHGTASRPPHNCFLLEAFTAEANVMPTHSSD
jgi:hypothetical protein